MKEMVSKICFYMFFECVSKFVNHFRTTAIILRNAALSSWFRCCPRNAALSSWFRCCSRNAALSSWFGCCPRNAALSSWFGDCVRKATFLSWFGDCSGKAAFPFWNADYLWMQYCLADLETVLLKSCFHHHSVYMAKLSKPHYFILYPIKYFWREKYKDDWL